MNKPRSIAFLGLALLVAAHGAALWSVYAAGAGPFTGKPLIEQDYGQHFHHVISARGFWEREGRLWGYNPSFLGGYISNTIQDASIKFPEIIAATATPFSPIRVFNIVVFLMAALTPVALAAGFWGMFAAWGGLGEWRGVWAVGAAALAMAAWWNGYAREMFFYGMIGFPPGCALSVTWLGLWVRRITCAAPTKRGLAALALIAILLPAVHIQAAGCAALLTFGLMVVHPAGRSARRWIELAGLAAIGILINAPWLVPMIRYSLGSTFSKISAEFAFFASDDPLTFAKAYLPWGSYFSFRQNPWPPVFRLALLLLAVIGVWRARRAMRAWGVFAAGIFLLTYGGSFIPQLRALQPLRFEVLLDFTLAPLAVIAVPGLAGKKRSLVVMAVALIALMGALAGAVNITRTERDGLLTIRAGLTPAQQLIIDWIKVRTPATARVLFEESGDETGFVYDGSYLSAFVPHMTGRSLIGGPANFYNDPASQTNFHSGNLLGRMVDSYTDAELSEVFRRYNIGAIVAFSPRALGRFSRFGSMVELDRVVGPVSLFLVRRIPNGFIVGGGELSTGPNSIVVDHGRKPADGPASVLSLHWFQGLVVDPPTQIRPVRIGDDPIPFIQLDNPPEHYSIRMR